MNILDNIKDKLRTYKYPTMYLIVFAISILLFNSLFLFFLFSIILSVILFIVNKDAFSATLGIGHYNSGKTAEAMAVFKKLIDKNSKNGTPYAYYGNQLLLDGKPNEAIEILEKGLTLKGDSIVHKNLVLSLSSCYWFLGDIKKAIELLEGLKQKYGYLNHAVLSTLGYLYLIDDNIEKALENTNLALLDDPKSSAALDNLGQISLKQGNIEKATEYFNEALEIKPNLVDSIYNLGVIELAKNTDESTVKAKEYFEKALTCNISVMNTVTLEEIQEQLDTCNKIISESSETI